MEEVGGNPRRVFLNNINSFSSRSFAQVLREGPGDEEDEVTHLSGTGSFQIVGTVTDRTNEDGPHVQEEYFHPDRSHLLSRLMECQVVIYDISQGAEQLEEATWAVTALHAQMDHFSAPKLFILVSTVMTWASGRPLDPSDLELPFTDEVFWLRTAHPSFTQHLDLEKRVVRLGKTNRALFSTYVVASGLQYGMGEQIFRNFFKNAWLEKEEGLSVFGDGKNIIPTIHITDLARIVHSVIRHQPDPYYLLAVDSSNNTMEDIVKAISSALGSGKVQKRLAEDLLLLQDMSMLEVSSMQVNLRLKAVNVKNLLSVSWLCESGLVENIQLVVEEYLQNWGLLPLRLCVLGPPAVGKTTVSKWICKDYQLHHVTLKDTISTAIAQLEEDLKKSEDNSASETQKLLLSLKDRRENTDVSEEQMKVLRDCLMSNRCRTKGFVLDDFPNTYKQAKELFGDKPDGLSPPSRRILPELVLCLDASDSFLTDRVMDLPQHLIQELHYEPEDFLRRLTAYRANNIVEQTAVNYFQELEISPLYLEVTSSEEQEELTKQKILDLIGPPRVSRSHLQEVEERGSKAEEKIRREEEEKVEEEQEARRMSAQWEEWTLSLVQVMKREEQLQEELTLPMRSYLLQKVMPTLTQGLMECCRTQPGNPLDFLAEFLFKNCTE